MELKNNYGDIVYLDSRFDIKKIKSLIKEGKHSEIDNYLSTIKGYPSHAQGGVDIKLGKDGFSFKGKDGDIKAAHGLVLPNNFGNPLEFEAMSKVLTQRNKHLNWVDRGLNPDMYPRIDNQDGTFSTHRLAYSTGDNGEAYVYPTIILNDKGELEQLDDKAAWEYAKKTKTAMTVPNVKLAEYYSKNGLIKHSGKESVMMKLGGYLAKGGPLGGDPKKRLTPVSQEEAISRYLKKPGYEVVQSTPTHIKMTDDQRYEAEIDRYNKASDEHRLASAHTDQDRVDQQEQIIADWFSRTPIPNSAAFYDDMSRKEFFKFKELSSEEQEKYIRDWNLRQAAVGRGSKNPELNQLITSLIPAIGDIQELKFFDHTDPVDYAAYAAGFLLPGTPSFFKRVFKSDFARKLFKAESIKEFLNKSVQNVSKINPWAFKPSSDNLYRGLGESGVKDAFETGVLRPRPAELADIEDIVTESGKTFRLKSKTFNKTYYSPNFKTADRYGDGYIAEVPKNSATFNNRYSTGKDWSMHTTEQIPIDKANILKKDWLMGYKKINAPKKQFKSEIDATKVGSKVVGKGDDVVRLVERKQVFDKETLDAIDRYNKYFGKNDPNSTLTMADKVKIGRDVVSRKNLEKAYRNTHIEEILDARKKGYFNNEKFPDTDWYYGGSSSRYGNIEIEAIPDSKFFRLFEVDGKYAGIITRYKDVLHLKGNNVPYKGTIIRYKGKELSDDMLERISKIYKKGDNLDEIISSITK